jgi:hypothetical protein
MAGYGIRKSSFDHSINIEYRMSLTVHPLVVLVPV